MIAINMPPLNGPEAGAAGLVEVVLDKPQSSTFSRFFGGAPAFMRDLLGIFLDPPTAIQTPAISRIRNTGEQCELALDTATEAAVDPRAMAALSMQPAPSGETSRLIVDGSKTVTLEPGRYRGGLWFTDDASVTLNPGLYIVDGGDLKIDGRSSVAGDGVSFVLTAIDPRNIGNLKIAGTGKVDLSAWNDHTSPYAGVLFHQDSRLIPPEPWHGTVRDWALAAGEEGWHQLRRLTGTLVQAVRSPAGSTAPANQGIGAKIGWGILIAARRCATAASWTKVMLGRSLIPKIDDPGTFEVAESAPTATTAPGGPVVSAAPAAQTGTEPRPVAAEPAVDLSDLSRDELETLETLVTNAGDPATATDPARTGATPSGAARTVAWRTDRSA